MSHLWGYKFSHSFRVCFNKFCTWRTNVESAKHFSFNTLYTYPKDKLLCMVKTRDVEILLLSKNENPFCHILLYSTSMNISPTILLIVMNYIWTKEGFHVLLKCGFTFGVALWDVIKHYFKKIKAYKNPKSYLNPWRPRWELHWNSHTPYSLTTFYSNAKTKSYATKVSQFNVSI